MTGAANLVTTAEAQALLGLRSHTALGRYIAAGALDVVSGAGQGVLRLYDRAQVEALAEMIRAAGGGRQAAAAVLAKARATSTTSTP
jgi:hypothetical protein